MNDAKRQSLRRVAETHAPARRQDDDIDMYEAAAEWGLKPHAAEKLLNREVDAGVMRTLLVRGFNGRVIRVWRDVVVAPPTREKATPRKKQARGTHG